jgi:hypothetical protein
MKKKIPRTCKRVRIVAVINGTARLSSSRRGSISVMAAMIAQINADNGETVRSRTQKARANPISVPSAVFLGLKG